MLSKESEQFLNNLRAYLMTSGKKESEILEITGELESHLEEAEKAGKSVEDIVGQSPATYMESIAGEMETDRRGSVFAGLAAILGAFSIVIFPDIVRGELHFSLFKLIGMMTIFVLFIVAIVVISRKLSKQNASDAKSIAVISVLMALPMLVFLALFLLDDKIVTPTFTIEAPMIYIVGAVVAALLIGISLWSKTWIIPLVVLALTLPDILDKFLHLSDDMNLYLTLGIYLLAAICIIFLFRMDKK